jgi:hypothetical protein
VSLASCSAPEQRTDVDRRRVDGRRDRLAGPEAAHVGAVVAMRSRRTMTSAASMSTRQYSGTRAAA